MQMLPQPVKFVNEVFLAPTLPIKAHSDLYWDGFTAYIKGAQLEDMQTHEERNGWWFALECQGAAAVESAVR